MTLTTTLLAILVMGLGGACFLLWQKMKAIRQRLETLNDRLYSWGAETRSMMEEMRKHIRRLDFELRRQAGQIEVTQDMRIADLLALHPRMKEVLAVLHKGGCSSSASGEQETLAAGAASLGLDVSAILEEIRRFIEDPDHYQPRQLSAGVPVQIQIPVKNG